ncbi:F-box-like domain superfamily [Arabidopsis suecica]|uniref:F-box-like domain superfamily n=1 Tax=Arabidopsis suecica TaxID=45249 RepID=A0A8T2AKJ7_ARASU|nr:F-box-like domain superfamily [Arabidopsis suecica]
MAIILRSSDPLLSRIHPQPQQIDHFDYLPDSILLLIFNNIGDVKALGRCSVVSKRFHSLIPQVENVVVRVDCVISDDDSSSILSDKPRSVAAATPCSAIFRLVFKPLQALGQFLKRSGSASSPSGSSSPSSLLISGGGDDGDSFIIPVPSSSDEYLLRHSHVRRFLLRHSRNLTNEAIPETRI